MGSAGGDVDIFAKARLVEALPLLDASDGSTSWFHMKHEEGALLNKFGLLIDRAREDACSGMVRYAPECDLEVSDYGVMMHSHSDSYYDAASFGPTDILQFVSTTGRPRHMVQVVTTSHLVRGVVRDVRYVADARHWPGVQQEYDKNAIQRIWNDEFNVIKEWVNRHPFVPWFSTEEWPLATHAINVRLFRVLGIHYWREIVR